MASPNMAALASSTALFLLYFSAYTAASGNATEFIKSHCNSTLYPSVCLRSLAPYAPSVQSDPVLLAFIATNVTLARARSVSSHLSALLSRPSPTAREAAVLRDCCDSLDDAVDLIEQSAGEIARLNAAAGPEVAWRVANAQTWLSAALTNEDTCEDGFEGVTASSPVKVEVCGRVRGAKRLTSNALSLVNSLVGR